MASIFYPNKKSSEAIEDLKLRIKTLNEKIQMEDNLITGYNEELNILQHNRQIGSSNITYNIEKLQQFASYYRKRTTEIKNSVSLANKKRSGYYEEIADINKQLNEFNAEEKIETGRNYPEIKQCYSD